MRTTFINTLVQLAEENPRIWLLCGDLGYSVLERFSDRFPDRFINVGVAEQNMAGIAAGLTTGGSTVFCYSIGNFPTLRCFEQVRNDICYHDCDVKIIAVGGGLAYGAQGYTHHAVEDLAVMRSLPGMTVIAPADPAEVTWATHHLAGTHGPCYMRLGKAGEPVIHEKAVTARPGSILRVREGGDVFFLSTGGMLGTVLRAAELLEKEDVRAGVASVPFLKPLDADAITKVAGATGLLCTVEEHGENGGLADAVSRHLAQLVQPRARLVPFTLSMDKLKGSGGSQEQLRRRAGLDEMSIAERVLSQLRGTETGPLATAPMVR